MFGVQRMEIDPESLMIESAPVWVLPPAPESSECRLSPDGSLFACTNSGSVQEDLWVVGLDGSNPRYLTEDPAKDRGAHWSFDGRRVYFYSDRNGSYEIWSIRPDGSDLTQHTDFPGRSIIYPVLSPRNTLLGQELRSGTSPFLLDASATSMGPDEVEFLPEVGEEGDAFIGWDWSPDGRRLAGIVSSGFPRVDGLAVYDREGGDYQLFPPMGRGPVWLDEGRRLALADRHGIRTLDTATGRPGVSISFYPDRIHENTIVATDGGRTLYFSRAVHQADVWIMDLEPRGADPIP
jgi:hypothetical protein